MSDELNLAHKSALELLKIVDDYCVAQKILYTLSGDTLITYNKLDFGKCYPSITISAEYEGYMKIISYLERFCDKYSNYSIHNCHNTPHFYTCATWFVKASRVKLNLDRKNEEFYYGTHLIILPLYYAGNSKKEWKKVNQFYKDNILPISFRKMLNKKPIITYLKLTPRRIRTNIYLKKRNFDEFENNVIYLENTLK